MSDAAVVLFLGDATVVDREVHALVDERLAASSQSLDFEIFRFGERPLSEIEAALRQVGMFSPKRCIWLRGFADSRRKAAKAEDEDDTEAEEGEGADGSSALLSIVESGVPAGTLFVVSTAALDARGKLFKWFAKNADVRDRRVAVEQTGHRRGKLSEQTLRRAVEERLRDLRSKPAAGAVDEIVRRSGNAIGETMQEVDRVVLAQEDPAKLTAEDVRRSMRDLSLGWVFDFTQAIEKRDLAAAEGLIGRLLHEGEPPIRLAALLASHIGSLVAAHPLLASLPKGALRMSGAEFLRGPATSLPESWRGWPGYFRLRAASNFGGDELRRLHAEVRRLDAALKSSPVAPVLLFSRLVQAACIPGAAATSAVR
jgi:DNA polymerase III delta subunit